MTAIRQLPHRACGKSADGDWRTWNLSRQKSTAILNATGIRPEGCSEIHIYD